MLTQTGKWTTIRRCIMTNEHTKLQYDQLDTGYEFPPASYDLDATAISKYLRAVGESNSLYRQSDSPQVLTGLVPPTAITTYAMTMLLQELSLPPGSIHVTQKIEFLKAVEIGTRIICHAKVSQKWERGKFQFLTIDLSVLEQTTKELVQSGKVGFILPS